MGATKQQQPRERKGERERDRVASPLRITGDVQSSAQFQIQCVRKVVTDAGISLEAGLASDLVMPKRNTVLINFK